MRLLRSIRPFFVAIAILAMPAAASAQVAVTVTATVAPPVLPVYVQPPIPRPGFVWAPGYWAWGPAGYYWVPGTWVWPPAVGLLWTPGYWGWGSGFYLWHPGYWGPHVGFYGGIRYGFGYFGVGFVGGYWSHGAFVYNRAVTNIRNTTVVNNTYYKTVINNTNVTRVSYNGGAGGVVAQPTPQEEAALHEQHRPATAAQMRQEHAAANNRALLASVNHGRPGIAATRRPGQFRGPGVVAARGAPPNNWHRPPAHAHRQQPHHQGAQGHPHWQEEHHG